MTANIVKRLRKMSAENPSPRDCLDEAADALERLGVENGNLRREAWTWSKACETATKQLEPVRIEAARYRWLRDERAVTIDTMLHGNGCRARSAAELDAAIDAAMLKTPNVQIEAPSRPLAKVASNAGLGVFPGEER